MAVFRINFFSQSLQRTVNFNMFMPNDPRENPLENGGRGSVMKICLIKTGTSTAF